MEECIRDQANAVAALAQALSCSPGEETFEQETPASCASIEAKCPGLINGETEFIGEWDAISDLLVTTNSSSSGEVADATMIVSDNGTNLTFSYKECDFVANENDSQLSFLSSNCVLGDWEISVSSGQGSIVDSDISIELSGTAE